MLDRFLPQAAAADAPAEQGGFNISLGDLRAMAWRQRRLVASVVALFLVLGFIVTLLMTPRFSAASTIRVDLEENKIIEGQDLNPAVAAGDTGRYLNTQKRVIESRTMAVRVADRLKLAANNGFFVAMGAKPEGLTTPQRQALAAGLLQGNVKVDVPLDSRVVTLSFQSRDPGVAARVANTYADLFIENNVRRRYDSNRYARRFLLQQIEEAKGSLRNAEMAAIAYARANQLIDAGDASASPEDNSKAGSRSITTANLVQLNNAYVDARGARILAEERWNAVRGIPPLQLPEVASNPTVQQLVGQRAQLNAQLAQLRQRYQPEQQDVQQLTAQLATLGREIERAAGDAKESVRNAYRVAAEQEQAFDRARRRLAGETLEEQDRRVQLNLISRGAETQRVQLNNLLERYNQVSAASDITANNISLIDYADAPTAPVSPNMSRNMALALALGLVFALAAALGREALDDTLRSPEDVERKLHLPLLGTTPLISDTIDNQLGSDKSELSEAYYTIRATLDYASPDGPPRTLQVTSSQPAEGKSTTAMALARDYARIGRKVLLIDADLRKPSVHRALGVKNEHGFMDVIIGHRELESVLIPSGLDGLHVLGLGPIPPNPVQVLSSSIIPDFIREYSPRYDLIIFDCAPVMGLADAPLIARHVDGVVVIVEANRAHFGQAKTAVRRLREAGGNILGIVMSKFNHRDAGYSYDYHYNYYAYGDKKPAKSWKLGS